MEWLTVEQAESLKDRAYFRRSSGELKTLRQHYIDIGAEKRRIDENYWAKQVFQNKSWLPIMITDWRLPNELEYAKQYAQANQMSLHTWRVYRSCVPMPDGSIETEHALDDYETDTLIVTSREEFDRAVHVFPQYRSYKPTFVLVDRLGITTSLHIQPEKKVLRSHYAE